VLFSPYFDKGQKNLARRARKALTVLIITVIIKTDFQFRNLFLERK